MTVKKQDKGFAVVQITEAELNKVDTPIFNKDQYKLILATTPEKFVRTRTGRGNKEFTYVPGAYMRKMLNLLFAWDWDFTIVKWEVQQGQAMVQGRITGRVNGKAIVKEQFGSAEVKYYKEPNKDGTLRPLSLGDDLKSAATDALKKCANLLGIADDVYAPDEFSDTVIVDSKEAKFGAEQRKQIDKCNDVEELELWLESNPEFQTNKVAKAYIRQRMVVLSKANK